LAIGTPPLELDCVRVHVVVLSTEMFPALWYP
jgi:hypothetical protein